MKKSNIGKNFYPVGSRSDSFEAFPPTPFSSRLARAEKFFRNQFPDFRQKNSDFNQKVPQTTFMESFQENKVFGDVFCRYLKTKFGWNYETTESQKICIPNDYPDIDLILNSKKKKLLYLQLKQPIDFEGREYIMTKSWIKIFGNRPFETAVKKAEKNYIRKGKNIHNIILLLHLGLLNGYFIPEDNFFTDKENFKESAFRGIYMVSPKHELWSTERGKEIQDEFVFEIKHAFN